MARKDKSKGAAAAPDAGSTRITPVDIQQKEFRESFRGYNERDVDQFLDQVTEEMARLHSENKRLQEQVEFRQTLPMGSASAEAEEIMRRAQAEADRIIERARGVAGGGMAHSLPQPQAGGLDSVEMVNRYLAREREFLKSLASRIQQHIEAVKEDVRIVREVERGGGGSEPAEPGEQGTGAYPTRESSAHKPPAAEYSGAQDSAPPEYPSPRDSASEYQGPDASLGGYSAEDDQAPDVPNGGLSGEDDRSIRHGWTAEDPSPEGSAEESGEADQSSGDDAVSPPATTRTADEPSAPEASLGRGLATGSSQALEGQRDQGAEAGDAWEDGGSSWPGQGGAVPGVEDTSGRETSGSPSALLGQLEGATGASAGVPRPEEDTGDERTLRELFWGED